MQSLDDIDNDSSPRKKEKNTRHGINDTTTFCFEFGDGRLWNAWFLIVSYCDLALVVWCFCVCVCFFLHRYISQYHRHSLQNVCIHNWLFVNSVSIISTSCDINEQLLYWQTQVYTACSSWIEDAQYISRHLFNNWLLTRNVWKYAATHCFHKY